MGNQGHLEGTEDGERMLCPQKRLGKPWGLGEEIGTLKKRLLGDWHAPGVSNAACHQIPECPVPFRRTGVGCGVINEAPQLTTEGKGTLSSSLMWLAWPVGPTAFRWRGKSHLCVALALRAFYALTGVDKCKVQQVHTCTCNWGPGSLSKGAFKWIKPFSCWRLNAL